MEEPQGCWNEGRESREPGGPQGVSAAMQGQKKREHANAQLGKEAGESASGHSATGTGLSC